MKNKLNITFKELKEQISEARQKAEREAKTVCSCVRSRGAWLAAVNADGNVTTESSQYEIKSMKRLMADVEHLKNEGSTKFFVDGGFDGADSVRDLNDCYDPWVSEWSIDLEVL